MARKSFNVPEYLLRLNKLLQKFNEEYEKENEKPPVVIQLDTLEHREQRNNDWRAVVPAGTTAEDINFKPGACALISSRLMLGDTLTLITADKKTMFRAVCVRGNQRGPALCAVTDEFELPQCWRSA